MPQIPTYENPLVTIPTSNEGFAARETAARRVDELGRQEGDAIGGGIAAVGRTIEQQGAEADQLTAQKEIGQSFVDLAQQQAKDSARLKQDLLTLDPNQIDAYTAVRLSEMQAAGEQFKAKFTSKRGTAFAEEAWGRYQAHFIEQAHADAATAAGHAVVANIGSAANSMTLAVQNNPAFLDTALEQTKHGVAALAANTPGLKPEAQAHVEAATTKMQSELFQAAVQSTIDKDPAAGLTLLGDAKYSSLVNLQERDHWQRYAEARQKAAASEQKAQETEQRRIEKDTYNSTTSQLIASTINPATGAVHVPGDFLSRLLEAQKLPGSLQEPERVKTLIDWFKTETDREAQGKKFSTDPTVYQNFSSRIFLSADDPQHLSEQEVFQRRALGQLNDRDFGFFREAAGVAERNPQLASDLRRADDYVRSYQNFFFRATLTDPGSPLGHQRFGEFQRDFLEDFRRRRASGEPARAIETDWGNRVPQYQSGLGELKNMIPNVDAKGNFIPTKPLPAVVPRNQGESAADYAARLMRASPAPAAPAQGNK
jgi:hypothetical protein